MKGLETTLQEVTNNCNTNPQSKTFQVDVIVQGDSQLIIKQLTGEYRCKNESLKVYNAQVQQLVENISKLCALTIEYQHVLRAYNAIADGKLSLE